MHPESAASQAVLSAALRMFIAVVALSPVAAGAATSAATQEAVAASDAAPMPRAARHALIIGVGEYASPAIPSLHGVPHDMESAKKMAAAMLIPPENIRYIRDAEATAARIEREIAELDRRTQPGDRVFLYFSGHGSRWYDPAVKKEGCVEALMPTDAKPLTNEHMAAMLKPISDKTDKLLVFYDACHSGGIVGQPLATRSLTLKGDTLTPKFSAANTSEMCAKPANIKSRAFTAEAERIGGLPQNIVQISSSRPDEVSFDEEAHGGLATQAWRDCMLGEARDLDHSGAIAVDEIAACAQAKLDARFAGNTKYAAQHFTVGGNKAFIPGSFSDAFAVQAVAQANTPPAVSTVVATAPAVSPPTATAIAPTTAPTTAPAIAIPVTAPVSAHEPQAPVAAIVPAAEELAPALPAIAALDGIYAQRDAHRQVTVKSSARRLRIGKDLLKLSVTSSHEGYVYIVMLGSDRQSFYMLFPNDIDGNNLIKPGETLAMPRKEWEITAQGPAGTDRILVVVTESPRNLQMLGNVKSGPFLQTLTDRNGRANMQWLIGTSANQANADCSNGGGMRNLGVVKKCSDAFGAALVEVVEK